MVDAIQPRARVPVDTTMFELALFEP